VALREMAQLSVDRSAGGSEGYRIDEIAGSSVGHCVGREYAKGNLPQFKRLDVIWDV